MPWDDVLAAGQPLVLHDALCPMTPAGFITECLARAVDLDRVVVGVRPVTDTVKETADGFVGRTLPVVVERGEQDRVTIVLPYEDQAVAVNVISVEACS